MRKLVAGAALVAATGIGAWGTNKADVWQWQPPQAVDGSLHNPIVLNPEIFKAPSSEEKIQQLPNATPEEVAAIHSQLQSVPSPVCPDLTRAGEVIKIGPPDGKITLCFSTEKSRVSSANGITGIEIPIVSESENQPGHVEIDVAKSYEDYNDPDAALAAKTAISGLVRRTIQERIDENAYTSKNIPLRMLFDAERASVFDDPMLGTQEAPTIIPQERIEWP